MFRFLRSFSLFCVFVFAVLTASPACLAEEIQPIKYVFLFIGDGMSIPQRQLAEEYSKAMENRGLRINDMPYESITTTYAANAFITDSAAAGTAIACGFKTNNGVLGLDAEGARLESIAETAHQCGRKVGIITSVTINHATPAAFYAHNVSRGNEYEIGLDLVKSGFEYFGGGGIAAHESKGTSIYALAQEAGYTVCRSEAAVRALKPGSGNVIALGSDGYLPFAIDSGGTGLRLPDFTKQAIELLDNPQGFFIMVEGGAIDTACHSNDAGAAILDTLEFDHAVEWAFEFAKNKPNEVLIVVTGDHETGALVPGDPKTKQLCVGLLSKQKASGDGLVALTDKFIKDNKEKASFEQFKPVIREVCGLSYSMTEQWKPGNLVLTLDELKKLEDDFNVTKAAVLGNKTGTDTLARTMIRILNAKAGVCWGRGDHTALPVSTSLWGNQAAEISKSIRDNTDIAKQLRQAVRTLP